MGGSQVKRRHPTRMGIGRGRKSASTAQGGALEGAFSTEQEFSQLTAGKRPEGPGEQQCEGSEVRSSILVAWRVEHYGETEGGR